MALMRGLVFALAVSSAQGGGSALVEGTTRLGNQEAFNGFVQNAIDSGKTAMVRWIASEG